MLSRSAFGATRRFDRFDQGLSTVTRPEDDGGLSLEDVPTESTAVSRVAARGADSGTPHLRLQSHHGTRIIEYGGERQLGGSHQ